MLLEKIEELLKEVDSLTAQNAEEVEQLRIKYLSKKGESMPSWPTSAMCQATRKKRLVSKYDTNIKGQASKMDACPFILTTLC